MEKLDRSYSEIEYIKWKEEVELSFFHKGVAEAKRPKLNVKKAFSRD